VSPSPRPTSTAGWAKPGKIWLQLTCTNVDYDEAGQDDWRYNEPVVNIAKSITFTDDKGTKIPYSEKDLPCLQDSYLTDRTLSLEIPESARSVRVTYAPTGSFSANKNGMGFKGTLEFLGTGEVFPKNGAVRLQVDDLHRHCSAVALPIPSTAAANHPAAGPRCVGRLMSVSSMAGQLAHLLDIAQRPNVEIRIMPLDREHGGLTTGQFILLDSPPRGHGRLIEPSSIYVDGYLGFFLTDKAEEVELYRKVWANVWDTALTLEQSIGTMQQRISELQHVR